MIDEYPELLQYPGLLTYDNELQGYVIDQNVKDQFLKD